MLQVHVTVHHYRRRRKNQQMTQDVYSLLAQHVSGIIMPVRRQTE